MKTRKLLLAFFVLLLIPGCNIILISEQQELALGQNAAPEIERQFGGDYHDPDLQRYVSEVGTKLVKVSRRSNIEYHFTVLNSPIVNAFALPGGYVYVTRGILVRMKNEAMLAAVLGHEITHVTERHGAKHISNALVMQVLIAAGAVYAGTRDDKHARETAIAVATAGPVLGGLILQGYGRSDEYEADHYGTDYMVRAGYNPRGMVQLLKMLKEEEKRDMTSVEEFFASHPTTRKRIEEVEADIKKKYPDLDKGHLVYNQENFERRTQNFSRKTKTMDKYDKARKNRHEKKYPDALKLINEAISEDPNDPSLYTERGRIHLLQQNHADAEKDFQKAKTMDPDNYDALVGYGIERLGQKDYPVAEGTFKQAVKTIPSHYLAHFYLADTYYEQKKQREAVKEYEMVVELMGDDEKSEFVKKSKKRIQELNKAAR